MDFFDKLGKKAEQTYKQTAAKTSKIAKEAKLKMTMNDHKSKIEELYEEIGKRIYQHHIQDQDVDMDMEAVVEEFCIQIDELCDRIEEERKELLNLKDRKQCPNCFYEIDKEFHYCPNCGDKQEEIIQEKDLQEQEENEENNNDSNNETTEQE